MATEQKADLLDARNAVNALRNLWYTVRLLKISGALADSELMAMYGGAEEATLGALKKVLKNIDSVIDAESK